MEKPLKGEKELRDSINKQVEDYENRKKLKQSFRNALNNTCFIVFSGYVFYNYIIPLI
jgi:hypothetical protein